MFERFRKSTARKYVELIYKSSQKYGVWDPSTDGIKASGSPSHPAHRVVLTASIQPQVGDFGTIGKKDGRFRREGNIYRLGPLSREMEKYQPKIVTDVENYINIISKNTKEADVTPGVSLNLQGASVSFQVCLPKPV